MATIPFLKTRSHRLDTRSHRLDNRYALKAEARYSWENTEQDGSSETLGSGETRDLSAHGAFIVTQTSPPEGVAVRMALTVRIDSGEILHLEGTAMVVRVTRNGFAVRKNLITWHMQFEKARR